MRRLLAGIATTVLTFGPAMGAFAAEALAPGSYLVDLGGGVVAEVTLTDGGYFNVTSVGEVDASISLSPQIGAGGWQDEFTLAVDGTDYYVDLNVADDGTYEVVVDGVVVDSTTADDGTTTAGTGADDDDEDSADDDAGDETPGSQGRETAREHGGKANGHGAEGTAPGRN